MQQHCTNQFYNPQQNISKAKNTPGSLEGASTLQVSKTLLNSKSTVLEVKQKPTEMSVKMIQRFLPLSQNAGP